MLGVLRGGITVEVGEGGEKNWQARKSKPDKTRKKHKGYMRSLTPVIFDTPSDIRIDMF